MNRVYPICESCGVEINPNKYENCETYYINHGRVLCHECLVEEIEDMLRDDLETIAAAIGIFARNL